MTWWVAGLVISAQGEAKKKGIVFFSVSPNLIRRKEVFGGEVSVSQLPPHILIGHKLGPHVV